MRKSVKVNTKCIADHYAGEHEKIVEFSSYNLGDPRGYIGGLVSFRLLPDGTLRIEVYHADKGVVVRAGGKDMPAHIEEKP